MRKISDFLSKPLISITNATYEGTIIGFLCEKKLKAVEYLVVLVENDVLDEKKYVALKSVKNATEDSVTVLNNLCIKSEDILDLNAYVENPINSSVYSAEGDFLGKLTDVHFGDTVKAVSEIVVDERVLPVSKIASTTKDIIVLSDGKPKRKTTPKKVVKTADCSVELFDAPPLPAVDKTALVSVASEDNVTAEIIDSKPAPKVIEEPILESSVSDTSVTETASKTKEFTETSAPSPEVTPVSISAVTPRRVDDKLPKKLISDFRFLLGRVVTDNVYNHRRELIIRRGQLVTAEVVRLAHKNNKLIELTLNSKL